MSTQLTSSCRNPDQVASARLPAVTAAFAQAAVDAAAASKEDVGYLDVGRTVVTVSAGYADETVPGARFLPQDLVIDARDWEQWTSPAGNEGRLRCRRGSRSAW